jgi:hypothetical protein
MLPIRRLYLWAGDFRGASGRGWNRPAAIQPVAGAFESDRTLICEYMGRVDARNEAQEWAQGRGKKFEMALDLAEIKKVAPAGDPTPGDAPSGEECIGISLIDLAEILDQHKIWVESGGESGTKADLSGINLSKADLTGVNLQGAHLHRTNLVGADLSMANLRGASLVRADLQNANLLGTELRGANLMGANAYGADGLWFGRLGGTNLFDAVLPESISAVDSSKAIGDATKVARVFYFMTVGASLLCCLLIAFTTDLRLLLNSSADHDSADERAISWRTAGFASAIVAIPFSAAAVMGKYGGAARGFSGWTNIGTRWTVVFDGAGATAFPVAGRHEVTDDGVRNGALDSPGILDCAGDVDSVLGAIPGAAGFPGHAAARGGNHGFGSVGDVPAICGIAGATARRFAAAEIEECSTPGSANAAFGACGGLHSFSVVDWCEPRSAV